MTAAKKRSNQKDRPDRHGAGQQIESVMQALKLFADQLSVGMVIADRTGKPLFTNRAAEILLKNAPQNSLARSLVQQAKISGKTGYETVSDLPLGKRVVRIKTEQATLAPYGKIILATYRDITEEWQDGQQRQVLEFAANTFAQNIPTRRWLESVLKRITAMLGVKGGMVLMKNRKTKLLEPIAGSGQYPKGKARLGSDENPAEDSARTQLPMAIFNTKKDLRYPRFGRLFKRPASLLFVPMVVSGKVVGVLEIEAAPDHYFREQDANFYTMLANRLAITMDYRNLVDRLKYERNRLATVVTNSSQGKILLNAQNVIQLTNPAFAGLIDQPVEALVGKKLEKIVPEFAPMLKTKSESFSREVQINSLPDKPWLGVSLTTITENNVVSKLVTIRDITSEKYLDQLKDEFVTTATHELRTPLTAILGYLSILKNKPDGLNEKQLLYIDRMEQASRHLSELVEDILSVLQLEQGHMQLKPERSRVLPIIHEVVNGIESKILAKELSVALPEHDKTVYLDRKAFKRVLLNLVDNAVKYSRVKGKITVRLDDDPENPKQFVRLSVTDTGVGIAKHKQSRLFQKFYRVPNELSVEAGGTGLGLHISKQLVEKWGGTIGLTESSSAGSTFAFTMPKRNL